MYAYRQTSYGSRYYQEYIGEINNRCNLNFVLDGTKDNAKVEIYNYDSNIIAPYTILKEEHTNTWWIVKKDRVERHKNEIGYFYIHQLELLGAVEILNARDLTDCGFNANRYTIRESIARLFRLANADTEFGSVLFTSTTSIDLDQTVTFTKTYENYTLLSALRELLNAYNCDLKIHFSTLTGTPAYISSLRIDIYSKTGDTSSNPVELDNAFDDIRELKELDSNSFGSVAVSNTNNVIASNSITYPSAGWAKLTSDIYQIDISIPPLGTNENARVTARSLFLKLPSNVFKVNYVDVTVATSVSIELLDYNDEYVASFSAFPTNKDKTKANLLSTVNGSSASEEFKIYVRGNADDIVNKIILGHTFRFYDGAIYNPQTQSFSIPSGAPSDFRIINLDNSDPGAVSQPFVLLDKDQRDHLHSVEQGFYWERGSNKIGGWERLAVTHANDVKYGWLNQTLYGSPTYANVDDYVLVAKTDITKGSLTDYIMTLDLPYIRCRVNYVPMSDIKIKIDNDIDTHNVKLFNQTGKLTDGVAFSKRLEAYSKEISSDNITRYNQTYSFDDIYKVGTAFTSNGEIYVINNVSIDILKNDNGYFFDNEYTLSKQVAVKSLMVNPDTNIRDYLIPQTNNVVRKTLFRDYYTFDLNGEIPTNRFSYLEFAETGVFDEEATQQDTFLVGIRAQLNLNGSYYSYYYQLSTCRFNLKKIKIYTLDFNDNNIIGYDCQNRWSGFNIQRLINNNALVTVPIQYTNDIGEVYGLYLTYCTKQQAETAYQGLGDDYIQYCNGSVFIDSTVYNQLSVFSSFSISLSSYRKDALEVPFFEYCIQFGDSNSVLVGDNILTNVDDCYYVYLWGYTNSQRVLTQENFNLFETQGPGFVINVSLDNVMQSIDFTNVVRIILSNHSLQFSFYTGGSLNWETKVMTRTQPRITNGGSYAIYRYAFNKKTGMYVRNDLMMIVRNVKTTDFNDLDQITLSVNHYELK